MYIYVLHICVYSLTLHLDITYTCICIYIHTQIQLAAASLLARLCQQMSLFSHESYESSLSPIIDPLIQHLYHSTVRVDGKLKITVTECCILEVLTDILLKEDVWINLSKLYIIYTIPYEFILYYIILYYAIPY